MAKEKRIIRFDVSGTIFRIRLYLDEIKIEINDSGVGYSPALEIGDRRVLNFSGLGFKGGVISIKMTNASPCIVKRVVDSDSRVLIYQCVIKVV